jgi:hypothetical protein
MCMVSVISQYGQQQIPRMQWTPDSFSDYKEILRRIEQLDAKLNQPDCVDPAKAAWMREVEDRLAALEPGNK